MNKNDKNETLWGFILVVLVAFVLYVVVATAAAHTAKDDAIMYQYKLDWLTRQH